MRLSKPQQQVIDLMKDGWELGVSLTMIGRVWLQKGGCGKGGPVKEVNSNTFYALIKRDLIQQASRKFPLSIWELKEGKDHEI